MISLDAPRLTSSSLRKLTLVAPPDIGCRVCRAQQAPRCRPTTWTEGPSKSCSTPALSRHGTRGCGQRSARASVAAFAAHHDRNPLRTADGKVGVVIVDHGSRKKASNDMLIDFCQLYGEITGQEIVEAAHMEIAAPTIEDAVGRCAARGATRVVVAPYFLSRGRHIQEDIPALVREAQQRHPGVTCVIAEPIGIDPLMVQLIGNRVAAALQSRSEAAAAVHAAADVGASS